MYTIVFTEDAKKDLKELSKKAPQAVSKLSKLLDEVREQQSINLYNLKKRKTYQIQKTSRLQ